MKTTKILTILAIVATPILLCTGCGGRAGEMDSLVRSIEDFENAWAEGDFLKVDSFFADNAKRLHTEPQVWDRAEITRWCQKQAAEIANTGGSGEPVVKNAWKEGREYLGIRVEGNIAYDVFTTETFKVIHIWEKQKDGSWKILFDMGMLNQPETESQK